MDSKLGILQHSLGVDEFGRGVQFRNHYCTGSEGAAFVTCNELVAAGLMVDRGQWEIAAGNHVFNVTPAGVAFMGANSPSPPVKTRSARRYESYRESGADMIGLNFGDWLKLRPAEMQVGSQAGSQAASQAESYAEEPQRERQQA